MHYTLCECFYLLFVLSRRDSWFMCRIFFSLRFWVCVSHLALQRSTLANLVEQPLTFLSLLHSRYLTPATYVILHLAGVHIVYFGIIQSHFKGNRFLEFMKKIHYAHKQGVCQRLRLRNVCLNHIVPFSPSKSQFEI